MRKFNIAEELEKERKINKVLTEEVLKYEMSNKQLQDRIDKAIEYIETHIIEDSEYENYMQCEREEKEELLDILKGR